MNRQEIDEKMEQAVKQGHIFVVEISGKVTKIKIKEWNKKHRCGYLKVLGRPIPIKARNYGRRIWTYWALTRKELESQEYIQLKRSYL